MKIALCGSQGKMGNVFHEQFEKDYEIIDITHAGNCLNDVIEQMDLVLDFTNAIGAFVHGVIALTHDVPIIIGSTGLKDKQKETLKKIANDRCIACVICNNFSYGIIWLKQALPSLYPYFETMHIEEAHHYSKLDSPSGTALALEKVLPMKSDEITSLRDDSYDVRHTITLSNSYEMLKFEHVVMDRKAYMTKLNEFIQSIHEIHGYLELE